MARRGFVVLLLAAMVAAWGISTAVFAEDYPDWSKVAPGLDAKAHLDIGGPNGKNFIVSGQLYDYVQAIGKRLGCNHKIYLVRNNEFNACATVSRIYIYTGLTTRCANANEVALAIGHEMTHIDHHHLEFAYMDQVNLARRLNTQIGMVKGKDNEQARKIAKDIAKGGLKLSSLHISRENEYDADLSGALLAKQAGYDIENGLKLFDRMGSGPRGTIGAWMATHPAPQDRKARILAGLPKAEIKEAELAPLKRSAAFSSTINGESFANMIATQNFSGYAYRKIMKDGPVYVFARGSGEMSTEGKEIVLPKGATEAIFVAINPKPANALCLRLYAYKDKLSGASICDLLPYPAPPFIAVRTPISTLTNSYEVGLSVLFGKDPMSGEAKITADTISKYAFRSGWLFFRQ